MILSMIGRCAILIHLSSAATFHGVSFNDKNQPYRNLQVYDCAQHNKRNQCPRDQNCLWSGGSCVAGPTSQPSTAGPTKSPVTLAPTNEPTNEPTPPPTSPPTNSPTVPGIGYCSQDPATNCWNVSECACAVGGGTAPAPAGEAGSSGNLFGGHRAHRALQNCSAANKKKDCVGLCAWDGGTCISATDEPTPSPVTSQPTTKPTNSPSLSPITGQPTRAPTPCACLGLGPTKSPTSEPTASPSLKPTNSPTEEPTPVPTNSPTKSPTPAPTDSPTNPKPTGAPTNGPTNAPTNAPTPALTNVPTDAPTPAPTNAPTNQPSDAPTLVQAVTCPPAGSPMVTITSGLKTVAAAAADTFCGIFRRMQSGDLIPLARSYHGEDWESAPGPFASPTEDVTATSILLPDLAEPSDSYVILSKNGLMEDRKKIAKFLEMTTFGPRMSEIDTLDDTLWASDPVERRAQYVRDQMDLPATSHREYWRQRTNSKWDATAQPARSSHPCSPNSKWRKYSFTRQDRYHTITSEYIRTTFETVPEEANFNYTIYEADSASNVSAYGTGSFRDSSSTSGTGYYDFGGTGDFLEFSIAVVEAGMYPVSFRYALSSSSWNGQRPCQLLVNDVIIESVYAFQNTDSWSYWMYSELVDVALNSGINTIKLLAADQNGGPNIDHMRIGKPPAVVIKTNGWPRAIAKNGLQLLEDWPFNYTSESVLFVYYPEAPQGDLYRYEYGRIRILLSDGRQRFLDIGNAPVDFTGYEQYLPPNVFNFALSDIFEETATDLDTYPIKKGQELLLVNGSTDPVCDSVPPFAEEGDAPILGKLPNGEWIVWSPTILFEDNGPSVNAAAQDMTANVLSDGGGSTFIQTGEKLKCANVQRSFINEDTCFLSTESTACSATQPVGEVLVPMNASSVTAFYDLAGKYVYAIRGLAMETLAEHACTRASSRWEVNLDALCSAPTQLEAGTIVALEDAITSSSSSNEFIRDVSRKIACDTIDETVEKINIQIQVGNHCYTHVHPNHLNVYDFSGWVTKHPGGEYNIEKWAEGWEGNEGWYLDYPFVGNITRGIPEHPMSRWYNRAAPPDVVFVSKFGDSIAFRDLPNDLKGDAVAQFFGAVPTSVTEGGIVVCGSVGEVSNNPALPETFDVRSDEHTTSSSDLFNNQKQVVWTEIALYGDDQLRQRMAWALAQIVTTVPSNINAYDRTEIYTKYYDIFVSNAFGNYRDILVEASYSPLMAEHLSYLRSKSHSYVYEDEDKRISRADENYAREVMQLFSIGLIQLNDDGTPVLDPLTGNPLETYTNEDIESFARAWTGFDRVSVRGNYEESSRGSTDNRLDPMGITPDWRDPFPKPHLNGGFIGDAYLLCKDLPAKSFLKKGAGYRLLGGKSSPELMKDPSYFDSTTPNFILRVELDPVSSLYQRLHNGGNPEIFVKLENDLVCTTGTVECDIDTVRVVKVGSIFYEFVEQPCVQMAFYENGKQIQLRDNYRRGQMCANTDLAHAREACCREDRVSEVRTAKMESGVTYLYEGERMTYDTARDRCVTYGRDLCLYERISITPNDDYRRKGYHWTNRDCGINVKVNSEGYIAIVHDAISSYINTVPYLVEEENTLNWFRVFWNGGSYPGDSETNTCEDNGCKILNDGHCLCKTTVTDSVVFTDIVGVTKENIMSQLFMGALGPQDSSTEIIITDELKVYTVGDNVDGNTIFEVKDNGRTLYMKNMLSTVGLEGWTMAPQIYEAEYATISNALVKNNTGSATGGEYVEFYNSDDTSFVEWSVIIPSAGKYAISLRFANDESPRPLSVSVNTQEITHTLEDKFYNSTKQLNNIGGNPPTDPPLERCDGDCDGDSDCTVGLFCLQLNSMESVPGCTGTKNSGWDYCVDIGYFDYGFTLLPTGGWTDDWQISKPLEVDLVAGENTIRVQMPPLYTRGPNIDHLKIEGLPTSTPQSSFRNPPHFMGLIPDYYPGGLGEQNLRDAQYETDAVLDHYFYHANVAPFMCVRIMQRFSFSNPSPRFVASCVESFRTGLYNSGSKTFGSGEYGSLEAMAASIVLDKEATEGAISSDPSYGGIREPMLKVVHLMRSMDYQTSIPTILDGAPMQTTYNVRLWKIDEKIGHGPYEFPTVFSYFLPEYVADSGPTQKANLASPESMVVTMPNIVNLLNGMFSMIKYGLSDCYSGFSTYPGYSGCYDDGLYRRSYGHLFYEPTGVDDYEKATNLALLLTAGRLSIENLNIIVESCSSEPDEQSKNRCMQQLIVTTGEFHTNNFVTQSGEDRETGIGGGNTTEPYKAIVYFYLGGGLDSYNMLAPHTCAPIDVYARYRSIRGRSAIAEGVGLPLDRLLEIQANNPDQPCTSFGIHENLPALKQLYDNGQLNFIANAGLMAKPVTVDNYRGETPVQLFAHNAMTLEAKREDLTDKFIGTGVCGRMADVLTQAEIPTNLFSIDGQQVLLNGEAGYGPSPFILSSNGLSSFNSAPSIANMESVIIALNNGTTADSGFYAETWSFKLSESLAKQELLKEAIDATVVNTNFPGGSTSNEFEMVTRIMQTREDRGSKRDIFFVEDGGYDTHSNVDANLINRFSNINGVIQAFVDELVHLGLWESTVVVQFSEFARTLDPNTGEGTDHAWGGQHFMFGGSVKGGHVLGRYPSDFEQGDAERLALSRGRMVPTTPWDAMWKGTAEWFGIPATGPEMDKVLPMHKNFPQNILYNETSLFRDPDDPSAPTAAPVPTQSPTSSAAPTSPTGALFP